MKNGRGFKNPSPQEKKKAMRYLKQQEHYYRVMRHKNHIVKLKDLNTRDSCISRMGFRCNVTGKTWVHNRWIKISTVPLRHLLKHELLPGWQRASWQPWGYKRYNIDSFFYHLIDNNINLNKTKQINILVILYDTHIFKNIKEKKKKKKNKSIKK